MQTQFHIELVLVYCKHVVPDSLKEDYPAIAIDELRTIASLPIEIPLHDKLIPLSLRVLSSEQIVAEASFSHKPVCRGAGEFFVFVEGIVPYDLDVLQAILRKSSDYEDETSEELEQHAAHYVTIALDKFVGDLRLAAAIAAPGALNPNVINCEINGHVQELRKIGVNIIAEARAEFAKTAWPPIANISLSSTLAWLHRIPGFEIGVPTGNVGRAVSALSNLLGYNEYESGQGLMWAMIGLESLYTRGREALSEQLREKVQTLLGSPESHTKRFKSLYDYRSKFIHGSLAIPLVYSPYDAADAFMRSTMDTYDAELTAIALLIATLQKMVVDDRMDLDFHWALRQE